MLSNAKQFSQINISWIDCNIKNILKYSKKYYELINFLNLYTNFRHNQYSF
ncbi:hypothetical protein FD06_GL000355 [Apilactobacillus ozensis DSM 23829 = JCM 17196]|uniref:Uncharacterized protein n=1 Tax=Apilactobacillus ozensis DSM 23829 = JCM 17196 TaxID=1423781 RepID=A0A0R2B2J8_9LACO|nr:hypothetical protein FD06_GL000355 [Apilactobacillus ozensis DSM 23829 = JCM 17196]